MAIPFVVVGLKLGLKCSSKTELIGFLLGHEFVQTENNDDFKATYVSKSWRPKDPPHAYEHHEIALFDLPEYDLEQNFPIEMLPEQICDLIIVIPNNLFNDCPATLSRVATMWENCKPIFGDRLIFVITEFYTTEDLSRCKNSFLSLLRTKLNEKKKSYFNFLLYLCENESSIFVFPNPTVICCRQPIIDVLKRKSLLSPIKVNIDPSYIDIYTASSVMRTIKDYDFFNPNSFKEGELDRYIAMFTAAP